ncbi:MAG: class I SAM-dependent methyltransferase [archaeon]|nr:class I SAM-dependent methyltransferase [archaeon]
MEDNEKAKLALEIGCGARPTTPDWYGIKGNISTIHTDKNPQTKEIKQLDIEKVFPYKDNTFDYIIARHVIEHLDDPHYTINECHRILKKGGTLIVEVPHYSSVMAYSLDHKRFFSTEAFNDYTENNTTTISGKSKTQGRAFRLEKIDYTITFGTILKPIINRTIGINTYERWLVKILPLIVDVVIFHLKKE